jgi:hypothetical protein
LEHAWRRGLGTALTATHLHNALARGCQTASLQSTAMAERVYAAVGFRDLGRILEYVPSMAPGQNGRAEGAIGWWVRLLRRLVEAAVVRVAFSR